MDMKNFGADSVSIFENAAELIKNSITKKGIIADVARAETQLKRIAAENGCEYRRYTPEEAFENGIESAVFIVCIGVLDETAEPQKLLCALKDAAKRTGAAVLLSAKNISYRENALALMEGRFNKNCGCFTEEALSGAAAEAGLACTYKNDVISSKNTFSAEDDIVTGKGSLINECLEHFKSILDENAAVSEFLRLYEPTDIINNDTAEKRPFLSVIMRTQGNRMELLSEALLCLSAQTDRDFECLIVAHNVNSENMAAIEELVSSQPDWLKERVRIEPINGGNRTTPLNLGFGRAKGRYIAIFDDDDIIFENWVETFHSLSEGNSGKVLHSFLVKQEWEKVTTDCGKTAARAISSFSKTYCVPFDFYRQTVINRCPAHSVAFPAYAFNKIGIRFNERLTTTEDWDFLMRSVMVCGVADSEKVTGIYRIWKSAENSAALHGDAEWNMNLNSVWAELNRVPLMLPAGAVREIWDKTEDYYQKKERQDLFDVEKCLIYYDLGEGYAENRKTGGKATCFNNVFTCTFDDLDLISGLIGVRIDPSKFGRVYIHDLFVEITYADGSKRGVGDYTTNGIQTDDGLYFLYDDPQIHLRNLGEGAVKEIRCGGRYEYPDEIASDSILVREIDKLKRQLEREQNRFKTLRRIYRTFKR